MTTEFYNVFSASRVVPQPSGFSPQVRRALARSMISYEDAVKLYWMMEFVADAPAGTDFVYVGPMDDLLERLGTVPEPSAEWRDLEHVPALADAGEPMADACE